jgi:hypothetical protein
MKKFLPLILVLVGLLVVGGVFLFVRSKNTANTSDSEEDGVMEVALNKRPIVGLIPTKDGHYLKLRVEKINIDNAETMDYELIYQVPDGPTQGVPGSVTVKGKSSFEADLLLGSESSGKFRYDDGVETGTITLRFRNASGKLLTKFTTDFHMQESPSEVTSADGKLTVTLDSNAKAFFVTMPSVGTPKDIQGEPKAGPYVIHSSEGDQFSGTASLQGGSLYHFEDGTWKQLQDGKSKDLGYFYGI